MSIAFWYITLSGKVMHFNLAKSSSGGVSNGLSRIDRAVRLWNLKMEVISSYDCSLLQLALCRVAALKSLPVHHP